LHGAYRVADAQVVAIPVFDHAIVDENAVFHQPLTSDSFNVCNARFSDADTAVRRMIAQ